MFDVAFCPFFISPPSFFHYIIVHDIFLQLQTQRKKKERKIVQRKEEVVGVGGIIVDYF